MNSQIGRYLSLPYRLEIYPDERGQGFTASVPDLPGCVTSGDSLEEVLTSIQDAKALWIKVALEEGDEVPEPSALTVESHSGKFLVRAPKSLHRRLVKRAEVEGVSLNQLVVTVLAEAMGESRAKQPFDLRMEIITNALVALEPAWIYQPLAERKANKLQWKEFVDVRQPDDAPIVSLIQAGTR